MKAWFQRRNRREQLLITTFVVLGALTWLSGATGRLRTQIDAWRSTRVALSAQQLWLDRQDEIAKRSTAAIGNLDPARTYDATKLVATVTTLAGGAGLTVTVDSPVTQRTQQFAYHTAKVTFRRSALPALLKFYDELSKQAPYLNLEQIAVQTDRAAVGTLNVTMQISATQIAKQ
jgi:hypothetical protein